MKQIMIIGAPVDCGKSQVGCVMGPDALRCAQIKQSLTELGHHVADLGNLNCSPMLIQIDDQNKTDIWKGRLQECAEWVRELQHRAFEHSQNNHIPLFLGGDHLMSAGTVSGVSKRAKAENREQFVLWLDAHPDFHTLSTTKSRNLHGTPVAYFTGRDDFGDGFPVVPEPVKPENI